MSSDLTVSICISRKEKKLVLACGNVLVIILGDIPQASSCFLYRPESEDSQHW